MNKPSSAPFMQPAAAPRPSLGGGRFGGIDPAAIAKAEVALKSLSSQFAQWLNDELVKLDTARAAVAEKGYTPETSEGLYFRAHDLKGLGSTYEYPLITRIAASLCRIIGSAELRAKAPLALIDAHIEAIKACVRDEMRDDAHPTGRAAAEELERRVAEHLASNG